jgi:hypothetical protein
MGHLNFYKKRNFFSSFSVNTWLIIANVFLFILFSLLISFNFLSWDFIAIKPLNILQGKYLWTFLTSMFMHGGFFHLFANMLSMIFVGSLVERLLGKKRYFWFYILSGIFAGLIFVLSVFILPQDMNTFAVGASGALFGLVGVLMFLTPNLPVYIFFIPIPIKMKYAAPGMLILLWLISIAGDVPLGNVAHFGGLVAGLIYGFYLRKKYKKKTAYISKYFS